MFLMCYRFTLHFILCLCCFLVSVIIISCIETYVNNFFKVFLNFFAYCLQSQIKIGLYRPHILILFHKLIYLSYYNLKYIYEDNIGLHVLHKSIFFIVAGLGKVKKEYRTKSLLLTLRENIKILFP